MSLDTAGEIVKANVHNAPPKHFSKSFGFSICAALVLIGHSSPIAQSAATQSGEIVGVVRPCRTSESTQQSKFPSAKNRKNQKPMSADLSGACIEIRSDPLQVQEYLQAWVRRLQWKLNDEHTTENSWDFSRKLDVDELLSFTKAERRPPGIEWQSGSTVVQITTAAIDDSFSRTMVRAQFRGIGENKDKFATQRMWYALDSNGSLESAIVEALKRHFSVAK